MIAARRTAAVGGLVLALAGCSPGRTEQADVGRLPPDIRSDYALFAVRCSKCHSLARPLNSGIEDDDYWAMYVARMRRQPGSGISLEDTVAILRFLHVYSLAERAKREKWLESSPPTGPGADADAAAPPEVR